MNSLKSTYRSLSGYLAAVLFVISGGCDQGLEFPLDGFMKRELLNPNLILNAGFEAWDTVNFPVNWEMEEVYAYSEMFTSTPVVVYGEQALQMHRNSEGVHRLFQKVKIEKGVIYEFSANIKGIINNYSAGGIEVFALSGESLGKHFVINSSLPEYKVLSVKFISNDSDSISVSLGFPDGMNATVQFDNAVLRKSQIGEFSPAVDALANYMRLQQFDQVTFDSNIEKISSVLNKLLIEGYSNYLNTGQTSYLQESDEQRKHFLDLFGTLLTNPYLHESFTRPAGTMAEAYCQRISLIHSLILTRFNIATRQIHWVKDGMGVHQFLEYWNPFKKKWIILDPFYGVKYSADARDLGSRELLELIESGEFNKKSIRRVNVRGFYYSEDEILKGWENYVQVQIYGSIRRTLP